MGMTDDLRRNTDIRAWEGAIPVHYLYTHGIAGERFFRAVKERGAFVAARCDKCDTMYVPPRIYCPRCMVEISNFADCPARGRVKSYTVCYEDVEGRRLDEPAVLAVINIDDTDGGMIHKLGGISPEDVKMGQAVEAVFKDKKDRKGAIEDILHFQSVK